jgi:UDP-glucuronate 4-epimerase
MKKILVTGSAGFIGFHVVSRLLKSSQYQIVGLDSINDYYDVSLKLSRLRLHGIEFLDYDNCKIINSKDFDNYKFIKCNLEDFDFIVELFRVEKFDFVIHLAAQAGVRYSIVNPREYLKSNINGFLSILEGAKDSGIKNLLYASTSSVYGLNKKMPLSEKHSTNHPISVYSASKKMNELMAHTYSHLFGIPTIGLRFFTVYGPWGRPDMALHLFTKSIIAGQPISLFNHGKMIRDFTYIDDVVESIYRLIEMPFSGDNVSENNNFDPDISSAPYKVFNVGNNSPINLIEYVNAIENALKKKAKFEFLPMQDGDVPATNSDSTSLYKYIGFKPSTSVEFGIQEFIKWYLEYYNFN